MPISVSYLFEKIRSYLPKEEIQLQGILQKNDKYFVLIDEKDKEYKVNILGTESGNPLFFKREMKATICS
ncbi:hypothetical protein QI155_10395 [Thermodesulfovibrio sp. 1176]|uniref:hypothetical protein n=1 Tax=Thermodesulfovibrio sp. 1176 TaxID=3043424 RepID=UPI002482C3CF|nr:hypothetical protein [Thermodesulfovibrio sp. 1176]MDI1472940.1 hypothetical protein [Thermodesulfovibrio sp. 1176]